MFGQAFIQALPALHPRSLGARLDTKAPCCRIFITETVIDYVHHLLSHRLGGSIASTTAAPTVVIRTAREGDSNAIAKVYYAALDLFNDFYAAFFESHPKDILPLSTRASLRDPKNHILVAALPESDAVVGFIKYNVIGATETLDAPTLGKSMQPSESQPIVPSFLTIKPHMKELWERFGHPREDEMDECYVNAVNGRKHSYVKNVMVDPKHQKKGVGAKLLQTIIEISDAERIPTFLVASAEGYNLYKRLGFQDLGTWTIDNDYWSKKIVQHEQKLGIVGNERLIEQYRGVNEVERYMMRWRREEQ
ncbi:gnat family acetyltransferase [Colletotrichum incanum]|uniref:Gnat family acetyltransferase n=1 Tax=Colletotrichum incanum TaxID=1573173 RepID=A0A167A735_COLIC|nr:gnat family acetyltransferase [Colletotrichum incanum]